MNKICPPLLISRFIYLYKSSFDLLIILVSIFFLPIGAVLMILISLISDKAAFKVLGMGVAVSDKTSISSFIVLIISLCFTPNLCSSSIISKPKL